MGRIASYNRYLQEPLNFRNGKITLSDKPGLGVEMNVDEIERTAVQMEFPEALV